MNLVDVLVSGMVFIVIFVTPHDVLRIGVKILKCD